MMGRVVLSLNSGSSTLKYGAYAVDGVHTERLFGGNIALDADDELSREQTLQGIADLLAAGHLPAPAAIGHRIVHGGPTLRRHCEIDDAVLQTLDAAATLAPLHAGLALAVMRMARVHFPQVPQIACFDTAFHAGLPDVARVLPLPLSLRAAGIERYGFHGLSCASVLRQLGTTAPARLLIAHIGNGVSVTAVRDGVSVDTSMGFTPGGGVMMGTRSGDVDPGVLLQLMRAQSYDAAMIADLVDHRSGLLGVSGLTSDMRSLHDAASTNPDADLAIRLFCYQIRKALGAMATVLGGVDTLVFTGGIGEHDWRVRAAICADLSWLGIELDAVRNRAAGPRIGSNRSRAEILVLPALEELQIALHTAAVLDARTARGAEARSGSLLESDGRRENG